MLVPLLGAALVGGCASKPEPVTYARSYPRDVVQGGVLDVQVFRSSKHIELTNTSARAFGPSVIWLNAYFSRPIEGLAVGETLKIPLRDFRDEYQDPFRGGGFFAPEAPERLVLAQIETPAPDSRAEGQKPEFIGLVVIGGEGE